uniref:Uncharacterized protein n=1 Tax=Romanomermis culicivorax TaxID=13658 RepID=A0A915IZW9_ROMCU
MTEMKKVWIAISGHSTAATGLTKAVGVAGPPLPADDEEKDDDGACGACCVKDAAAVSSY